MKKLIRAFLILAVALLAATELFGGQDAEATESSKDADTSLPPPPAPTAQSGTPRSGTKDELAPPPPPTTSSSESGTSPNEQRAQNAAEAANRNGSVKGSSSAANFSDDSDFDDFDDDLDDVDQRPLNSALPSQPGITQPANPPPAQAGYSAPAGQWVYTEQYGWVWMPYGNTYTYVPSYGSPQMYVYYPTYGWRWVVSPWVLGWGPQPYWGPRGPGHFYWHSRSWRAHNWYPWHGGYRGHTRSAPHPFVGRAPHAGHPGFHGSPGSHRPPGRHHGRR